MNLAKAGIGPAHEDDALAVTRPGREQLECGRFVAREASRRAVGHVLQPQASERFEHDLLAVRRDAREARHVRLDLVRRNRRCRRAAASSRCAFFDVERNVAHRAGSDVDALDAAAGPEHDVLLSGIQSMFGYRPLMAHVSCMSRSRSRYSDRSWPDTRSLTNRASRTLAVRTRCTKASQRPSGDGVGRTPPPGSLTQLGFAGGQLVTADAKHRLVHVLRVLEGIAGVTFWL